MKNFKLSLRTEIIINMTILMLTMIVLVSLLVILISKKDIYLKKAEGSLDLIQALSNETAPVFNVHKDLMNEITRKKELGKIANRFLKGLTGVEVMIANESGSIYYNSDKSSKTKEITDKEFFENLLLKSPVTVFKEVDKKFLSDAPKKLFVYYPIMNGNEVAGEIVAKFSLSKEIYSAARSQSLILLSIVLDAVLFIVFGSFLLSRVIVKPMNKLVKATEKIAAGNLDYKVESFPSKEIDSLSRSFNIMTNNLKESEEHLKRHVDSLEKMNEELKQAKSEVLRSEKLASVGRLAAGIAHEVGNPLGAIVGYLDILKEGDTEDLDDYLRRIHKECYRIDVILRELLDYSKKKAFCIEEIDLNELIKETLSATLHRKLFEKSKINTILTDPLPTVTADKDQIQQVITNMLINSADALEETGGSIDLKTEKSVYGSGLFSSTSLKEGDELVCMSIHDTGSGINQEDLDKIFDPFYTTKEPGKGTGLGLAICLRIVESFNGSITVASEMGEGTTFNIYLPSRGLND